MVLKHNQLRELWSSGLLRSE